MTSSKNDIPMNQSVPKNIMSKADTYEDEIDLIDYFRVLWRRKYFIVLGSVLPALIVFLFLFFSPKDYKVAYIYDTWLDKESSKALSSEFEGIKDLYQLPALSGDELLEKNRRILLDKFYSEENLDKLAAKLRENGFDTYAKRISKTQIQLEISNALLTLAIIGSPEQDMQRISLIVRDDFEKVIPIYTVREELSSTIAGFKAEMADIKENSFSLELELGRKRAILKKMKNLQPSDPNKIPGGIILQIDEISQNSEYLPLAYQIQAIDANIINIEENINVNQQKYNYYNNLISLTEKLFDEVKNKISSYYTVQEFHSFLANMMDDYTEKELADYLNAYTKRIENMISINTPVIEKPSVYPIPKGAAKKSTVVFAVLLMITTLTAFLLEAVQQKQAPTS
jgi:hypothetical protein